jgi:hypothetical protein
MLYTLFLHYPEMTAEEVGEAGWTEGMAAFDAYGKALDEAGVLRHADVLQPSPSSTTVSAGPDGLRVQDGPYADTKEQVGGFFVLDLPDLDAAIAWAEKAPSVGWGSVEIRPSGVHFADGAWVPSA